ncbi:MAG: exonuclease SbcCD subunit D [Clostridiales bacterium]|nr:exonuclease SbcCD subunit D [Clostridiales bacterium]
MKIIHTADWHLGKNLEGQSRLPEQERFLKDFVRICDEEQADLILIAGDIYDSYNPPAMAELLFYDTLKQLSRGGACMTVIISGNHDNPDRLTASGPLAKEHGIVMAGTPNTVIPVGKYGQNHITESGPGYIHTEIQGEKADILLVPFPSEKRLGELYLQGTDEEFQKAESYEQRMRILFSDLAEHFRPDAIHLIISHLFVMDSTCDGSERSIQLGGSYLLPGNVFPESADYIALGHVHKPQKVPGRQNARYSGAPLHYNQREIAFENQILSVEAHIGTPVSGSSENQPSKTRIQIREIPLPVYKPIEVWRCDSPAEAIRQCEEHQTDDSWVYLEIKTDHYIHEEDIRAMKRLKADILSIRPVFPEGDEGRPAPEKMEEPPFEVLVQNYYRKRFQVDMEQETLDLLMSILNDNEETNL